ncbi:MAG: hypothetical protein ACLPV8_09065 [Steroidobacteraceae bacterium]
MKTQALSVAILLFGATGVAIAQECPPAQAPEIDPASMVAALTLLGGGLAVLRSRRPHLRSAGRR